MALGFSLDFNVEEKVKCDFLILGGGVAGLSAANQLASHSADVVLLEEGGYPAHKICGEFLSPETLPLLEKWSIQPSASIEMIQVIRSKVSWQMELPQKAASIRRYTLDEALAKRAIQKGAKVIQKAKVINIAQPKNEPYKVTLSTGEEWQAPTLLISTGRLLASLTLQAPPRFCYIGAKAHFKGIDCANTLQMHLAKGAYFGIAPIGDGHVNVAGLIACSPEEAEHPEAVLSAFFQRSDACTLVGKLLEGCCLFDRWMTGPVPEFGIRSHPYMPHVYFLGDAAGTIPPAAGNGLSMGLTSGILAAECALKGDLDGYHSFWNQTYAQRIRRGQLLHRMFLTPLAMQAMTFAAKLFPALPRYLYRSTRGA